MKRNIQTTNCHHLRSRSGGFVIRQQRVSGFVIRMSLLLLMMVGEVNSVWGQNIDKSIYYIKSHSTANGPSSSDKTKMSAEVAAECGWDLSQPSQYWYIWPSVTTSDPTGQNRLDDGNGTEYYRYLTTLHRTDALAYHIDDSHPSWSAMDNTYCHWVVKYVGTDTGNKEYYQIINAKLNKYLIWTANSGTKHVQLEGEPNSSRLNNSYFYLEKKDDSYYIHTRGGTSVFNVKADNKPHLSVAGGNHEPVFDANAVNGLIQGTTNSSYYVKYDFNPDLLTAPTISDVSATNTITITDANSLPTGYTIRYTTGDGSQAAPTATTGTVYEGPIVVEDSWTVKAIVVRYDIVLTSVAEKTVSPAIIAPTVTNNYDGTISLSSTTPNAMIYYTTNGTTPSSSNGTLYDNTPFSLGNATVIKAITYNSDLSESSGVTTYNVPQYTAPTISFNSSTSLVTINSGSGGTVYYTTDGGTPTTSSTAYSAPFSVTSNTLVKAVATHAGYLASETATQTIITEPSFQYKTGFSYVYDGTEKEPIDHLEFSSTTIPSTAYLLTYTNNQNAGTATVTITDSGADDGFFVYGSTTFTITAAPLSITAEAKSKGYGDVDPELTYTYSGLVGGESIGDNLTGALERVAGDNVGTYAINIGTLACSSGNYTISFLGANFTITPKSLGSGTTPATGITIDPITKSGDTYSVPGINHNSTPLTVGTEGTAYDYSRTTDDSNPKYHIVTFTGANNYTGSVSAKFVNVDFHPNSAESEWTSSFVISSSEGAFATPTGYTAHIVTEISDNVVTAPSLSYIPEGAPVILLSTASSNGFMAQPTSGAAPDVTENKLAVSTGTSFTAGEIYILYNGEFVLNAAGTLPAGKVYLPKSAIAGSRPAPSRLFIDWDESTGIDTPQLSIPNSQFPVEWYTLDGRRLNGKPVKKGLYLRNGQKMVVR